MHPLSTLRTLLLAVLALGLVGTIVELLLISHYEDTWQVAPVILVGLTLVVLVGHAVRPAVWSRITLRTLLVVVMASGVLGIWFHYQGAAEFQYEIDPSQDAWTVFSKVVRAKAPPVLAPGLMMQLGLLGLIYLYCDRAISRLRQFTP